RRRLARPRSRVRLSIVLLNAASDPAPGLGTTSNEGEGRPCLGQADSRQHQCRPRSDDARPVEAYHGCKRLLACLPTLPKRLACEFFAEIRRRDQLRLCCLRSSRFWADARTRSLVWTAVPAYWLCHFHFY